jgi:hypothetical protein
MTLCQAPLSFSVADLLSASLGLPTSGPLSTGRARGPGAPEAPPEGREALDAVPAAWYFHARTAERAQHASVRGPRKRRRIEGASTTSHADIR